MTSSPPGYGNLPVLSSWPRGHEPSCWPVLWPRPCEAFEPACASASHYLACQTARRPEEPPLHPRPKACGCHAAPSSTSSPTGLCRQWSAASGQAQARPQNHAHVERSSDRVRRSRLFSDIEHEGSATSQMTSWGEAEVGRSPAVASPQLGRGFYPCRRRRWWSGWSDLQRPRRGSDACMTAPVGKLVRYKAVATGDIHNPGPGLKALRHNLRLQMVRPPAVSPPRLTNITPPDKPIPTIRHTRPPSATSDLLAAASPNENARNQWDRDAAYAPTISPGA